MERGPSPENGRRGVGGGLQDIWYDEPGGRAVPASLARFCGGVYSRFLAADQKRMRREAKRLPAFVLSVGNLVAGGTGKTPFVRYVAECLAESGAIPAVLSRGYGGSRSGFSRVDPSEESSRNARLCGDEPTLLAERLAPLSVWVGRERWRSGSVAVETAGATVLVLDDGFQHLRLHRDLDIVLLDAAKPFGNGWLLPLGPLREPLEHLERADALVLTRADDPRAAEATRAKLRSLFPGKPVFACRHRLAGLAAGTDKRLLARERMRGLRALAFAGIARPGGFFRSLEALGVRVVSEIGFPDHHVYTYAELLGLFETASRAGASALVTTEKDHVRLSPECRASVLRAPLEMDFGSEEASMRAFLTSALSAHLRSVGS